MATAAITSGPTVVSVAPFLIKKYTYTGGTTISTTLTHGEAVAPDLISSISTDATNHDVDCCSVDRTSATTFKIATKVDTARTGELYLFWFPQSSGGLTPP